MKIVVDTNIVFSAMLNTNSRIAQILTQSNDQIEFYSPKYLLEELNEHQKKLQKLLKLQYHEIVELQSLVTKKINFVSEKSIASINWISAERITHSIDQDDIAFVALALEISAALWTGDKKIINGIKEVSVLSTDQLRDVLDQL